MFDLLEAALANVCDSDALLPGAAGPYVEKLFFDAAQIRQLPKTYIRCTRSEFISATGVAKEKIYADVDGWICVESPSSHVPTAHVADEACRLLIDAAA